MIFLSDCLASLWDSVDDKDLQPFSGLGGRSLIASLKGWLTSSSLRVVSESSADVCLLEYSDSQTSVLGSESEGDQKIAQGNCLGLYMVWSVTEYRSVNGPRKILSFEVYVWNVQKKHDESCFSFPYEVNVTYVYNRKRQTLDVCVYSRLLAPLLVGDRSRSWLLLIQLINQSINQLFQ